MIGIWEPSIAPMHWGKLHLDEKPSTILQRPCPVGKLIIFAVRCSTIAWETSCRATHVIESPTPNKLMMILSSLLESSLVRHSAAPQKEVFWQPCTVPEKVATPDMKWNVAVLTLKLCFHSISLQPVTARGKYVWFLCLTQTVLRCMRAVAMQRSSNKWKTPVARLVLQRSEEHVPSLPSPLSCVPVDVLRASCAATSWQKQRKHRPTRFQTPSWYLHNTCVFIGDFACEQKQTKTGFVPGLTQLRQLGFDLVTSPCEKGIRRCSRPPSHPLCSSWTSTVSLWERDPTAVSAGRASGVAALFPDQMSDMQGLVD